MNIEEYVQKYSKEDRTKHINLNTECIPAVYKRNSTKNKSGDICSKKHGGALAQKEIRNYLQVDKFNGNKYQMHTCHKCANDSSAPNGFVCINPLHLYIGTKQENELDKPKSQRISTTQSKKHYSQLQGTCPHCGKTGKKLSLHRHHFDRCKYKSSTY